MKSLDDCKIFLIGRGEFYTDREITEAEHIHISELHGRMEDITRKMVDNTVTSNPCGMFEIKSYASNQ